MQLTHNMLPANIIATDFNTQSTHIHGPGRSSEISTGSVRLECKKTKERLSILVAEDDALIGILLGDLLAQMGHTVCSIVSTEGDAVTAAAKHKPKLMIVDAQLRDGSGVSAVETILRAGAVPYFFISGAKVLVARPNAFVLQKPFSESQLAIAIRLVIDTPKTSMPSC